MTTAPQQYTRPYLTWLRASIIIGVLTISAFAPLKLSTDRLILLVGLVCSIGVLLFFIRLPEWGLIALIIVGLIVPSPTLPGGFNFAVLLLIVLIGLWLFNTIIRTQHIPLIRSRTVRPLLYLLLVVLLSFIVGQLSWFRGAQQAPLDAQIGGLMIFVLAVGAFLLVAHQVTEVCWLERMTWTLMILGGVFVLGWVVSPVGTITAKLFQERATANALFWTWLAVLSFSQALFNEELRLPWRIVASGICMLTMYVAFVLAYDWKSGWLPPMIAIAGAIIARSWQTGIFLVSAGYIPFQLLSSQAIATDEYSYSTRLDAWIIVLNMIKVNPILGFGPANYYWYTPLFRIRGYAVRFNSHNQYLDILAQTGILGMGCVLWFFVEIAWLGWQLRERAPKGFARAYVYGALGGLAGTIVSGILVDWFFPFAYNIGLSGFRSSVFAWLFLGGLVAIEQMIRRETNPEMNVVKV